MKKHTKHFVLFFAAALFAVFSLYGQQRLEKRPLTHDDYDSWKSIASSTISADGNWVLYLEVPQDGDAVLVVKNLKTEKEYGYSIGYTASG